MADVGRVLGDRYHLLELVGQGGMATIYRARDDHLGRDVAIKVLRAEYGNDAAFVLRFRREAQAAAQLSHPNVVSVYDAGTDDVGPYIVMELVTGGDLAAVLRDRGPLPAPAAARIAQQIADALEAAHARGIVHRDIKPSNVLLTSGGRVKVADFGIAQALSQVQVTLTQPGMTMGSVHYFSPEQARGASVTVASDVYSTGLVLFEMLTGMRPFGGDSAAAVAMARLSGQVPSPAMVRPDVPASLDGIVRWALAPDPRARPTATELSMALGRFLSDPHGTSAYQAPGLGPAPVMPSTRYAGVAEAERGTGRAGWLAALAGLFVLVTSGVLVFLAIAYGGIVPGPEPSPSTTAAATPAPPTPTPAPTPLAMPPFEGLLLADAERLAARSGVVIEIERRETALAEPDTVLTQDPSAGTIVAPGSTVVLVVAEEIGAVGVPDLRLMTESDAFAALADAGLVPGTRFDVYSNQVPVDRIVRSDPKAGTDAPPGTSVDYWVSRGPRPTLAPTPSTAQPTPTAAGPSILRVVVGNYQCQDLGTTRQMIEDADLRVGLIEADSSEFDDSWVVFGQIPPAGTEVLPGRRIRLSVMDPAGPCP
jgi:serine/threonine-protein kinase